MGVLLPFVGVGLKVLHDKVYVLELHPWDVQPDMHLLILLALLLVLY